MSAFVLGCSSTSQGSPSTGDGSSADDAATGASQGTTVGVDTGDPRDDDAQIVDANLPSALACGESSSGYVVARNRGLSTWTAALGYGLGAVDDSDPLSSVGRIALPADAAIAPGEEHTFDLELVAPATPGSVVTDWQMLREGVAWFGDVAVADVEVSCAPAARGGPVRLEGRSFADDGGPFLALGATMMWAAWAYRNDRPRLEANLEFVAAQGFGYVRALGVVGDPLAEDYWDGREIEFGWPDYADVIAGLTALAWDEYGLRIEWTFIGDGQVTVPASRQRDALVDLFVELGDARPEAIMHFELANESWQNGFGGPEGLAELRARTEDLRGRTDILVAASAGMSDGCADMNAIYDGDVADIATVHTDRNLGTAAGPWGPVLRPLAVNTCANLPPLTNNEPIGPGASVATRDDPERLVAGALATWLAGWPAHVFHSHAGVRGDDDLSTAIGIDRFAPIVATLPGDLASWTRREPEDPAGPLRIYATVGGELVPDVPWTDVGGEAGVAGFLQSEQGDSVIALAVGITGAAQIEARVPLTVDVVDILSAQVVANVVLAQGERFTLEGAGARILRATRL